MGRLECCDYKTDKMVYAIKNDGRYNARLVVQGCKQDKEQQEYQCIISAVVKGVTVYINYSVGIHA